MGGPSKASSIALFHNSMIRFISFPFYFPKSLIFLNFSKIARTPPGRVVWVPRDNCGSLGLGLVSIWKPWLMPAFPDHA